MASNAVYELWLSHNWAECVYESQNKEQEQNGSKVITVLALEESSL